MREPQASRLPRTCSVLRKAGDMHPSAHFEADAPVASGVVTDAAELDEIFAIAFHSRFLAFGSGSTGSRRETAPGLAVIPG